MYREIEKKINDLILKDRIDLGIEVNHVKPEDTFQDIGLNSIGFVKLLVTLETELEFQFNDEDLVADRFGNVHSLIIYIIERLSLASNYRN
jgi:acyl carrier protein